MWNLDLNRYPFIQRHEEIFCLGIKVVLFRVEMYSCKVRPCKVQHEQILDPENVANFFCLVGSCCVASLSIPHKCSGYRVLIITLQSFLLQVALRPFQVLRPWKIDKLFWLDCLGTNVIWDSILPDIASTLTFRSVRTLYLGGLTKFTFKEISQKWIIVPRKDALPLDKPVITLDVILVNHNAMFV